MTNQVEKVEVTRSHFPYIFSIFSLSIRKNLHHLHLKGIREEGEGLLYQWQNDGVTVDKNFSSTWQREFYTHDRSGGVFRTPAGWVEEEKSQKSDIFFKKGLDKIKSLV